MWWMTEDERLLSIERLRCEGRDSHGKLDWSILKRVVCSWQFYCFSIAYGYVGLEIPPVVTSLTLLYLLA